MLDFFYSGYASQKPLSAKLPQAKLFQNSNVSLVGKTSCLLHFHNSLIKIYQYLYEPFSTFRNLLEPFRTFWNPLATFGTSRNLSEPFGTFRNIGTFRNLSEPLGTFRNISKPFRTFKNILKARQVTFSRDLVHSKMRRF